MVYVVAISLYLLSSIDIVFVRETPVTEQHINQTVEALENALYFWRSLGYETPNIGSVSVTYTDNPSTSMYPEQDNTYYIVEESGLAALGYVHGTAVIADRNNIFGMSAVMAHELGHTHFNKPDTYIGASFKDFWSVPCIYDIMCNHVVAYQNSLTIYLPLIP